MPATEDYIYQAADSAYWPADIRYDPENDGNHLGSLGVCEHWNNAEERKYSRNLQTGNGIELIRADQVTNIGKLVEDKALSFQLYQNYPNPFNPTTKIVYSLGNESFVTLKVFDILGKEIMRLDNERSSLGNMKSILMVLIYQAASIFIH